MKPLNLIAASLVALSLAASGNAGDTSPASDDTAGMPMDMAQDKAMDHGDDDAGNGIGYATVTIRSIGGQGDFLTIEHGEFEGDIQMGAMTMGFDIMGDTDLSGFAEGDEVAVMVKQGRDGSYRVMAICDTAKEGPDCLELVKTPSLQSE